MGTFTEDEKAYRRGTARVFLFVFFVTFPGNRMVSIVVIELLNLGSSLLKTEPLGSLLDSSLLHTLSFITLKLLKPHILRNQAFISY